MKTISARVISIAAVAACIAAGSGLVLRAQLPQPVDSWVPLSVVPDARIGAASVSIEDGRTVITGGASPDGVVTNLVLAFDPLTGVTSYIGYLLTPREDHTATPLADGRVLVTGGTHAGVVSSDAEIFDPVTGLSMPAGSLSVPRAGHAAARLLDGSVLIVGGTSAGAAALETAEIYDPIAGTFTQVAAPMHTPRSGASATTLIDGRVLVAGGDDGAQHLSSAEMYDPLSAVFTRTESTLAMPRRGHAALLLPHNGSVLLAGGVAAGEPVSAVELFLPVQFPDPYSYSTGQFGPAASMAARRARAVVGAGPGEGHAFVSGGGGSDAEVYRFATIRTDKDDYAPGERAIITGTGWQPGEQVKLLFQEDPAVHEDYVVMVTADWQGNIYWDQWAPERHDIGVRFFLMATDSRSRAQITFTDGLRIASVAVGAQTPNPLVSAPGNQATFTVTPARGNNGTVNGTFSVQSIAPMAAGLTASFSPSTFTAIGGTGFPSSTLTFVTNGTTAPGTYIVTVRVADGIDWAEQTTSLVITAPSGATTLLASATAQYGESASLSATLSSAGSAVAGRTVSFSLNGTPVGDTTTNASGIAVMSGVSIGATAAGSHAAAVTASFAGDAQYLASTAQGPLVVAQREIAVTGDPKVKTYGEADPALTYQVTTGSLAFSDAFSGALSRAAGEDVGSYAIGQGTLALSNNYTLAFVGADLTIGLRAVTVTADAQAKTYGDADPALTYQVTTGSLAFSDAFSGALSRAAGEDAGSHAIVQGTLALSNNYTLAFVGADLTIEARAVTVTANAQAKTYGDADPTLTYQVTAGALVDSDAFTGALTREPGEEVGTYAIQQGALALSSNYDVTFVGANLAISERAVTVTADAQTKTYGDDDPALTYQTTSGSLAFSDAFSGELARAAGGDVGSYAITQGSLALSSNYTLSFVDNSLTITARPLTVAADAKTKIYGDADPALTHQITSGSLAFTDAFSGALSRAAGEDVGSYAIGQGTLALSSNYTLAFVGADLTIDARAVTVTADAQTKVYGDGDPGLTYTVTNGTLVDGDVFSGALTRDAGEIVGAYAITQGTLALSGNYALTFEGANLTVTARAVTVTADAQTKTYGEDDPALTYQITSGSLVFSDAFSGALSRVAGENAGSYAIGQGTLALSANYALSYVGANLTIAKRPLTVTARSASRPFGAPNPDLSTPLSIAGFVNGESADAPGVVSTAPTCSTEATSTSPVGPHDVMCNGADAANYGFEYVKGTLTIGAWHTSGFYQPVGAANSVRTGAGATLPAVSSTWNTIKGGSTVPLKFNLYESVGGPELTSVGAVQGFSLVTVACSAGTDDPADFVTTGKTELRYDTTDRQFVQNWQSPKGGGACYRVTMTARDGSSISAFFKTK